MVATIRRLDVVGPGDINDIVLSIQTSTMVREMEGDMREVVRDLGNTQLRALGVDASFTVVDARVVGFLSELATMNMNGVTQTTRQALRLALAEGVALGEGVDALARRVRGVFSTATITRSKLIARTEVNAAANFGRWQAMEQSGVVTSRRWLATRDNRTRDRHRRLNGQIQPMGQPFVIGASRAMYPGGFSSAAMNVNCRCTTVPVINRDQEEEEEPTIPVESDRDTQMAFDLRVLRWEDTIQRDVIAGFRSQERDVLESLRIANLT